MGFFEGLGRMVKGEPVFQSGDASSGNDSSATSRRVDGKNPPRVILDEPDHRDYNGRAELYVTMKNQSDQTVVVDFIEMLGVTTQLERYMKPGEEYELRAYVGQSLRSGAYTKARLQYRDESGDYFCAHHYVEYRVDGSGVYEVVRIKLTPPIQDV